MHGLLMFVPWCLVMMGLTRWLIWFPLENVPISWRNQRGRTGRELIVNSYCSGQWLFIAILESFENPKKWRKQLRYFWHSKIRLFDVVTFSSEKEVPVSARQGSESAGQPNLSGYLALRERWSKLVWNFDMAKVTFVEKCRTCCAATSAALKIVLEILAHLEGNHPAIRSQKSVQTWRWKQLETPKLWEYPIVTKLPYPISELFAKELHRILNHQQWPSNHQICIYTKNTFSCT